ncbi:hypothetical protein C0995_004057 [Termitomyces sp. Mi166|nr:hypothetical protein C0995_004057 [Termitomyces sp. Mi166\
MDKGKVKTQGLSNDDILQLRQAWQQEFVDIINGTKEELPPWREVNHEINLIDENKQYKYHLSRCPQALQEQLHEKMNQYINAKWWEPQLWTVLDAWQCNDNTIKDVTPLLDQEVIREDVAKARYRSKIDLTDTYEQVCIHIEDIPKTVFASLMGTFTP